VEHAQDRQRIDAQATINRLPHVALLSPKDVNSADRAPPSRAASMVAQCPSFFMVSSGCEKLREKQFDFDPSVQLLGGIVPQVRFFDHGERL
jgi:hypothetical protein